MPTAVIDPATSVISGQCLKQCTVDVNIYLITYDSVTNQTVIYLFIIYSRNRDEYCRIWIEYLNGRFFKVCILDRSITLDK